jgi:hypothetical protein
MTDRIFSALPVPPALVYLLHQLREHQIAYRLYGEIPDTEMVFVDLEREIAANISNRDLPNDWSVVTPHFLSQRALEKGLNDPIADEDVVPEAVVIAYGGREAEKFDHFQALCEQVRYLRSQSPSRLVYHSKQPPEPMEIHQLIEKLKVTTRSRDE